MASPCRDHPLPLQNDQVLLALRPVHLVVIEEFAQRVGCAKPIRVLLRHRAKGIPPVPAHPSPQGDDEGGPFDGGLRLIHLAATW